MLNVTAKSILAAVAMSLALTACGDKDKEKALELYSQTEAAIEARNYSGALVLLDTLNSRYPGQTEVRRQALCLRAAAMEGIAMDSIESVSEALAQATLDVDKWRPKFKHISSSVGLDGYFIPAGAPEKVMTTTGIQPRVSEKGLFYIVANVEGKAIGLKSLEFVEGAASISSSAISASRVVKVEGSESASFNPEDLEGIGAWLKDHPGTSKLILHGSRSTATVKINDKLRLQLVDCYEYSCALQAQRLASIKREKFERLLATARDQKANLTPVPDDSSK